MTLLRKPEISLESQQLLVRAPGAFGYARCAMPLCMCGECLHWLVSILVFRVHGDQYRAGNLVQQQSVVLAAPPSPDGPAAPMPHDNQVDFQLTGKERDMVQRVANGEVGRCDDASRSEFLDSIAEYFSCGLLQRIERYGRRNVCALRPRRVVQNGKQMRFRLHLLR